MSVLSGRPHDLGGGLVVRRLLPQLARRSVGPFVFFDAMGPATLPAGSNSDVRPHPHIGLATVTMLFAGSLVHRDSLGVEQVIRPGDVNWMSAGGGIVHSERAVDVERDRDRPLHGLQLWCALPDAHEQGPPSFAHHGKNDLPVVDDGGVVRTVYAGRWGLTSPVQTLSPLLLASVRLPQGARCALPHDDFERAVYVVEGSVACGGVVGEREHMLTFAAGADVVVEAGVDGAFVVVFGGASVGPRHLDWNFCASRRELLTAARQRWRERGFPSIPGDDVDFIPLPG